MYLPIAIQKMQRIGKKLCASLMIEPNWIYADRYSLDIEVKSEMDALRIKNAFNGYVRKVSVRNLEEIGEEGWEVVIHY